MTTPNLKLPEWAAAQDQPWVPENATKHLIDALIPSVVVSDAQTTPPASPAAGSCYIVAATATGAWAGWENDIAAFIGGTWVQVEPQEGWSFWVVSNSGRSVYTGGSWVVDSVSGGIYDFGIAFAGTPITAEIMGRLSLPRATTCPADFLGSVGHVGVNPAAQFDIDVQADGTSIGTISISTAGVFTFVTAGNIEQVIAAGALVTFVGPVGVDAAIIDITATLIGGV